MRSDRLPIDDRSYNPFLCTEYGVYEGNDLVLDAPCDPGSERHDFHATLGNLGELQGSRAPSSMLYIDKLQ
jgi:hypothetical protein